MIKFKCPKCQTEYEEADDWIGAKVSCETCDTRFYVPETGHEAKLVPPKIVQIETKEEPTEPEILCTECGVSNSSKNENCSQCGKLLYSGLKTEKEPAEPSKPTSPPQTQSPDLTTTYAKHCPGCGATNSVSRLECWKCNAKFVLSSSPQAGNVVRRKAKVIAIGIILLLVMIPILFTTCKGNSEGKELAYEHLNVNGIMFDRSVSASLRGKYPPETNITIWDSGYDTLHYAVKNGRVAHFEKLTPRLPLELAQKKVKELKPVCTKLLSYYSGVPIESIEWESVDPGMMESVRIRARAKNYRAYLIIHDNVVGSGNMVTIAFTRN